MPGGQFIGLARQVECTSVFAFKVQPGQVIEDHRVRFAGFQHMLIGRRCVIAGAGFLQDTRLSKPRARIVGAFSNPFFKAFVIYAQRPFGALKF